MIDIQNVSKSYKKKHIFDSLDMQFQNHKITILLGEMVLENLHYCV